jgi:hypothetical protein
LTPRTTFCRLKWYISIGDTALRRNKKNWDRLTPLSGLLTKYNKKNYKIGNNNNFLESTICTNWDKIIGTYFAPLTLPTSLVGGRLTINVSTPVFATELSYMADEIKDKINKFIGRKNRIVSINFRVGPVVKPIHKFVADSDLDKVELTDREKDKVSNAVAPLKGDLKDLFGRVIEKSMKRRKLKNELINKK